MALTLRNKHCNLFKTIAFINPGFGKIFVPGIGIIRDEWAWCDDNLKMMYSAFTVDETEEFNAVRRKLLIYCRWRANNPVSVFEYPVPEYTLTSVKPERNYLDYSIGNINVYLVSKN